MIYEVIQDQHTVVLPNIFSIRQTSSTMEASRFDDERGALRYHTSNSDHFTLHSQTSILIHPQNTAEAQQDSPSTWKLKNQIVCKIVEKVCIYTRSQDIQSSQIVIGATTNIHPSQSLHILPIPPLTKSSRKRQQREEPAHRGASGEGDAGEIATSERSVLR